MSEPKILTPLDRLFIVTAYGLGDNVEHWIPHYEATVADLVRQLNEANIAWHIKDARLDEANETIEMLNDKPFFDLLAQAAFVRHRKRNKCLAIQLATARERIARLEELLAMERENVAFVAKQSHDQA